MSTNPQEQCFYRKLLPYRLPTGKLREYKLPCPDPCQPNRSLAPPGGRQLVAGFEASYKCERCKKPYQVDERGVPTDSGDCIYHKGRFDARSWSREYVCCKGGEYSSGCTRNRYHVHDDGLELARFEGYVTTQPKPEWDPDRHGVYALDCEMCFTVYGLELVRVTVVDYNYNQVYEQRVRPTSIILDPNTHYHGITAQQLEDTTKTLVEVQKDLLQLLSSKSILIGHSLEHDMRALKMFHENFVDTSHLYPHPRGLPWKQGLKQLLRLKFGSQPDNELHDSNKDACDALRLVKLKIP